VRDAYALLTVIFSRFQPGVEAAALRPPRASSELFDPSSAVRATATFPGECW